jgi:hypothetical protein
MHSQLPEGWVQLIDAAYSSPYYYNEGLGITQWEHPGTFPQTRSTATNGRKPLFGLQMQSLPAHSDSSAGTQVGSVMAHAPVVSGDAQFGNEVNSGGTPLTCNDDVPAITRDNISLGMPDVSSEVTNQDDIIKTSESTVLKKKPKPAKLTHDYEHLANLYKFQRKYMDAVGPLKCVLCQERLCSDVLFPCQHRCVCPECIVLHQVCEHQHMGLVKDGHFNCPLCGEIIKRIIPSAGGSEVDQYWEWVLAVKPPLPNGFMKNFRHSAAVIEKVYIQDKTQNEPSRLCAVS